MKNNDKDLAFFLFLFFFLTTAKNMLSINMTVLHRFTGIMNLAVYAVLLLMIVRLIVIQGYFFRINRTSLFILSGIVFFWVVSFVINRGIIRYSYIRGELKSFLVYALIGLIIFPLLNDPGIVLKYFYKYSYLMAGILFLGFVLFRLGGGLDENGFTYSMSYGNNAVMICLIFLSKFMKQRHPVDVIMAAFCGLCVFLIGSRFPLLYIAAFIAVRIFLSLQLSLRIIFAAVTGSLLTACYVNLQSVLDILALLVSWIPIESRTLSMLQTGAIAYDSGRELIHQKLFQRINESPFLGYGAGGAIIALDGEAAHSFVYDCIGTFGWCFGLLFLMLTFIPILKACYKQHRTNTGELMLILACGFFPTIFIQTSLWGAYRFWWLAALAIQFCHTKQNYQIYERCEMKYG